MRQLYALFALAFGIAGTSVASAQRPVAPITVPDRAQPRPVAINHLHYDVWGTGAARKATKNTRFAAQTFVATSDSITRIELDIEGTSVPGISIRLIQPFGDPIPDADGASKKELAQAMKAQMREAAKEEMRRQLKQKVAGNEPTIARSGNVVTVTFPRPREVTPGSIYSVEVTLPVATKLGCRDGDANYRWGTAIGGDAKSPEAWRTDLNLRIHGGVPPAAGTTNKRALIVIMENGGVTLSSIPGFEESAPTIDYWVCKACVDFKIEYDPEDEIVDVIGSVAGQIWDNAGDCLGCLDPGNWKKERFPLASWFEGISDRVSEDMARAVVLATGATTKHKYDKVIVLEDAGTRQNKILDAIYQLGRDYELDIHVLTHGSTDCFIGYDDQPIGASFFSTLAQYNSAGHLRLRAVYQMNCVSGTLVDDWQAVGADVVNGTAGTKNNYMPTQYFGFLSHWLNGEQFDESVRLGFEEAKPFYSVAYSHEPHLVTDSQMQAHGNRNLRITD